MRAAPEMRSAAGIAAVLIVAGFTPAGAQEAGVTVARAALPPPEGAYHGGTHVFSSAGARLFCGTHGGFTSSVVPPAMPGTTVIADYRATFIGELVLGSAAADVHPISEPVHMVERITFGERRGDVQVLDTEIVALDLQGSDLPRGVLVRESLSRGSFGRTTITTLERGRTRIESYYDVWLELSTDGGRSWHAAEAAVRMSIAPEAAARRGISTGG
jgi:hypothetical protein